jgi:hypothetical protein
MFQKQAKKKANLQFSAGSQYLNSLGLSQSYGEVGYWENSGSVVPCNDGWSSFKTMYQPTSTFVPYSDGYKNAWDAGGNVDFKYNHVLNSTAYNFGFGNITNELSIGYQNGNKGPMIEFQNGVISGSANIGDFNVAYSKENYSAQISYNYTDNKSFTLGASPNSFSWGFGSDLNGYSLYYGSTNSVNMSAAAAAAAAIIMYYCPVTVPCYYYFGFGF